MSHCSSRHTVYALMFLFCCALLPQFFLIPLGFHHDDTQVLLLLEGKNSLDFILSQDVNRHTNSVSFTPLLYISLLTDMKTWGINGWGYSLHNALSYLFLGWSLMFFFRSQNLTTYHATISSAIILLLPSVVAVSAWASTRHYLEGMSWSILSLTFLSLWSARKKYLYFSLSLLFFSLAILSKEIYLPLIAPAIILTFPSRRNMTTVFLGFSLILICYFCLRYYLMGAIFVQGTVFPEPSKILSYLALCWPRFMALSVDLHFLGFKAIITTIIAHIILFFSLFMVWHKKQWIGIVGYLFLLTITIIVTAPVLSSPMFNFALSHNFLGNRFIFPFAIMLFTLFFLSFYSFPWCKNVRWNKNISCWIPIFLLAIFTLAGIHQATEWQRIKLTNKQWTAAISLLSKEHVVLTGPYQYLMDFVSVARFIRGENGMVPKTLEEFTTKQLPTLSRPEDVYLLLPGHPVRHAYTEAELHEWLNNMHSYTIPLENLFTETHE